MNWSNVKLILVREVHDQLRDRRTMFMIFVLPILLYPFMGMGFFQMAQFMQDHPTRVIVIGSEQLPSSPKLIEGEAFVDGWFSDPEKAKLLELVFPAEGLADWPADSQGREERALELVREGVYDAALVFPSDFAARLAKFKSQLAREDSDGEHEPSDVTSRPSFDQVPDPELLCNTAKEKSQIAFARVAEVIRRWREAIGRENLITGGVPERAARPFDLATIDVAEEGHRDAAVWSKILPFLLFVWALTGAFYPAIDLCAGEKERGTLETLLSGPAERSEIVWGKLLTVIGFSMATVLFNLLSMAVTGILILGHLDGIGAPPPLSFVWLALALPPVSALFGALCLALAAFAKSSKEGQYYLMPLMLITLPLMVMPMSPGVDLTLGNSLMPITGVILLLRTLIEGNYVLAVSYIIPVAVVTLACCWFAIRWAVDQFNSESVLFRESERLDIGLWLRRVHEDRGATPTVAMAAFCVAIVMLLKFFMGFALPDPFKQESPADLLVMLTLITQVVTIATPALIMAVMLTRSVRETLLLKWPPLPAVPLAIALAICLHPGVMYLQIAVQKLYPINTRLAEQLDGLMSGVPFWNLLFIIAVVPAICEELAFRGFILSGFRHLGHKWRAIILSSIFFGIAHGIFQQSIVASLVGIIIGYIAVQTGSLLPCILYHMCHNALALISSRVDAQLIHDTPLLQRLFIEAEPETGVYVYNWPVVAISAVLAVGLLSWLRRLQYARSDEESLQEAIDHQTAQPVASA